MELIFPINCPFLMLMSLLIELLFSKVFPKCFTSSTHGRSSPFSLSFSTFSLYLGLGENIIPLVFDLAGFALVLNLRFRLFAKTLQISTMDWRPYLLADNSSRSSAYPRQP